MQVLRGCMGRSRNPGDKPGLFRQVFEAAGEEQDRELILTTGSPRGDPGSAVPEPSALALLAAGGVATDRVRRKWGCGVVCEWPIQRDWSRGQHSSHYKSSDTLNRSANPVLSERDALRLYRRLLKNRALKQIEDSCGCWMASGTNLSVGLIGLFIRTQMWSFRPSPRR
jgi:hypothetical protein